MTLQLALTVLIIAISVVLVIHYLYLRHRHVSCFKKTRAIFGLIGTRRIRDDGEKTTHPLEHQIGKWRKMAQRTYMARYHEIAQIIKGETRETMSILDIGCYDCYLFEQLMDVMDLDESDLYGLDLSSSRLSLARQRLSNVNLVQGDAENLPWQNGEFDVVICSETLEHLLDPVSAIAEMKRVLAENGLLILTVPSKHTQFISYPNPLTWLEAMISIRYPSVLPPFHNLYSPHSEDTVVHRAFSFSEIEELLRAGWHNMKIGSLDFFLELVALTPKLADGVRKLLTRTPIANKLGATIIVTARSKQPNRERLRAEGRSL